MTTILEQLDAVTRGILLRYGFDAEQFGMLQARVGSGTLSPESNIVRGHIEPPADDEIVPMAAPSDATYDESREAGLTALRQGQVAMAVLNGGMATRFGGVVKGIVEAVDGRSFLEWKLIEASRVARAVGGEVPCVVMNSFATDQPTRDFVARLERADRTDDLPGPLFFSQSVSLRLNADGSLFLDDDGTASPYAPGHGDFNLALRASGMVDRLRERGVRIVMLSNIDNLGARPDPLVVGAHLRGGRAMTTEVVDKAPNDAGGAPARVDGRTIVLEGFRFPPAFRQERIGVFSINSFVFDLDVLDAVYPLTWFYVEKAVAGRRAVQLERLVNELTSFVPSTYLRVPRDGPGGRFFPIKTPVDLAASQTQLREMLAVSVLGEG